MTQTTIEEFDKIEIRVGRIVRAEEFPKARKPALKLWIDFGEFGVRQSSAQITDLYTPGALLGTFVLAVINFPPRKIADFVSEVLVLGIHNERGAVVLVRPEFDSPLGARLE